MSLSSSQKQQLFRLYNSSNDSFFTFLNSADYEKKMKKLSNAKEAYAFYAYDEEPLFLLDDTDFGSADDGMVISNKYNQTIKHNKSIALYTNKRLNTC